MAEHWTTPHFSVLYHHHPWCQKQHRRNQQWQILINKPWETCWVSPSSARWLTGERRPERSFALIDCKWLVVLPYRCNTTERVTVTFTFSFHFFISIFIPLCHTHTFWICHRKNLILGHVVEERTVDSAVYSGSAGGKMINTKRVLVQAMIPGIHLVKVELSQSAYQEHVQPLLLAA